MVLTYVVGALAGLAVTGAASVGIVVPALWGTVGDKAGAKEILRQNGAGSIADVLPG